MDEILKKIRQELLKNSDEQAQLSGQRFFKEAVKLYGVKTAVVKKIAKSFFKEIKARPKKEIYELCERLWQSGHSEQAIIACYWSYDMRKSYHKDDFKIFEGWVRNYVDNWASCDSFCNQTIGSFIEMYPGFIEHLKKWARSDNLWECRAAAVSLIAPARKGLFLQDIFEIAEILLTHEEDLVQKGYGWMLKAASKSHQKAVFNFVMHRKSNMPRTALRYAIEKMPPELKSKAMEKPWLERTKSIGMNSTSSS